MRNASRARKMRNHLDQFKRSVMRLENGIIIQTLKKTRRGIYLSLFVRVFPNAYLRKKMRILAGGFCPKVTGCPFVSVFVTYSILVCLSFLLINFCLLLTTLYISIAQIHTDELSLSLSLSVCACTATQKMSILLLKIKRYRASTPTRCKSSRCNTPRSTDTAKPI